MTHQQIEILSITVKLQRLCDLLRKDARLIYKKYGANFMNKWYPVLIALDKISSMSLAELAVELGYAHPSVIELVNEMEAENLIKSSSHKKDKRKRIVSLTAKGEKLRENILPFAGAMADALFTLTDTNNNILKALDEVDKRLNNQSFFQRVDTILSKKKRVDTISKKKIIVS